MPESVLYQLTWQDYTRLEGEFCVIGDSKSLFEVYFHLLKDRKWDKCKLWRILPARANGAVEVGEEVLWWKDDLEKARTARRKE